MKIFIGLVATLIVLRAYPAIATEVGMPCADSNIQAQRSLELQKIREADQGDRSPAVKGVQPSQSELEVMSRNDLNRRMRVGEIFGEGCLKTAADYEAAFLVYQHGNTPDQYFQAFLWSKEAVTLGANQVKSEVAMAVDRYLVSTGHKQLFGTQATQTDNRECYCIQPIEPSFPASFREEYRGGINAPYTGLAYLKKLNKDNNCPTAYCDKNLLPSPQGIVPGFW